MKNFARLLTSLTLMFSLHAFGQVSFTASVTSGCVPQAVTFTNTSSNGVTFDWYMGDGTQYLNQFNASHTYTEANNWNVTLDAFTGGGNYIGSYTVFINIIGPPQEISMPQVVCPGDEMNLSVYMQDAVSWSWDFGDGATDSGSDYVQHTYTATGEYYPTVTITSSCGTYVVTDTVTVTNSLPYFGNANSVYIYVDPDSICPNSIIYGQTANGWSNYVWDYDDGNFGYTEYEQWTYASIGIYNVTLTITNGCGIDTVMTEPVVVSNATPVQNPQYDLPDTICPNEPFWAASWATDGVTFVWDMDDGSPLINNSQHEHVYTTPGIYNPTVTITNDCGNNVVYTAPVVVDPNGPVNNPYVSVSQHLVCPGDQVQFWSNSDYDYYIDFGDGNGVSNMSADHAYSTPGTYVVTATIQNACGNSAVVTDTVIVDDNIPINPGSIWVNTWPSIACPGTEIDLDASYGYQNYQWDLGDGSTAIGEEVDHIYYAPGVYNVQVLITNGCGSSATVSTTVEIQNNLPVSDVNWSVSADTICPTNSVFFEADEDEGAFSFLWDLGDGTTSTTGITTHAYTTPGVYPIEMTITNGCGNDSTVFDTVVVSNSYVPVAGDYQAFAQAEGCLGDELYFVLMPAGAGTITWDFGDGNSTSVVNQVLVQGIAEVDVAFHAYTAVGTYWATYTITNACGNSFVDSIEMTVGTVGDNINMDVSFWWDESQTACQGQPIEFMAVGGASYIWDFGDGSGDLLTNSSLTPVYHTYANPGSYTVTVNAINQCGNTDDSDENIFIPQSQMDITTNTVTESNCGEINGMAIASVSGGMPPYSYSWTNGDNSVIADSLGSGIYVITVTDNNGCSNEGIATVSDVEGVTILVDNIVDIDCYGDNNGSISVSLLGGAPPYTILWSNGDQTEDIFGLQAGPYEIFVTDANGCFAVESIEVIQPGKSNVSVITQPAGCGTSNGSAIATVNNGTGPYNYIWPNTTGPSNSTGGLQPGVHTLLVIDGNTCLLQKDFSINENGGPIIITDSTITGTCNGTLSAVHISTIGGVAPFTYDWSNGSSSQNLTGILPGGYTVEVEGANGCSSFQSYEIIETKPSQATICMVDVDSITGTNLIVWTPVLDPGIESYNIYKESSEAGLYYLIGNQSADSISQYFDYLADPGIRSWRYKVAAVDDCGNEATWSDEHKTIHLTANKGISGEVNLIWDHYEGFTYPTYYVHRYHPSTGWELLASLASTLHSYTEQTPPGDSSLVYLITINTPSVCTAQKAQDYNSSRSNKESVNAPAPDDSGIGETTALELSIYPNPTDGIVYLRYAGSIDEIRLFDVSGKLVYFNNSTENGIHQIDMTVFDRGVYNVQLFTTDGVINGKIIRD